MNIVDEYILQRFPNKETGKPETDKPYKCRIRWHRLGYPTAEELAKHCNSTSSAITKYMSLYGWTDIKNHAVDLQVKQDQIELRERQKSIEEKHRRRNQKLGNVNEEYLDRLLDKLEDETLTPNQRAIVMIEIRETRREISSIQRDERTTEHLPNAYKDTTPDELKIKQEGELKLKHHHENKVQELRDYEDYFKQLDSRAEELSGTNSTRE